MPALPPGKGSASPSLMATRVTVLGKGRLGDALGRLLIRKGFRVKFGSHSAEKLTASAVLASSSESDSLMSAGVETLSMADAVACADIVFLAVPGSLAVELSVELFADAADCSMVLVDLTNPVAWKDGPCYMPPCEGSIPQAIMTRVPHLRVVKGFNTLALEQFLDPGFAGIAAECAVCSDDAGAKQLTMALARELGFQPVDFGGIHGAAASEKKAIATWLEFRKTNRCPVRPAHKSPRLMSEPVPGSDSPLG